MSTIRLTGLASGLDTESIITQLVSAKQASLNSLKKACIKLSWKVSAWKTLNSKIYSLYSSTLSNLRFNSAYQQKKTTTSNSCVSVTSSSDAVNGVQSCYVKQLAKAAYLTGGKIESSTGSSLTKSSTMSSISGFEAEYDDDGNEVAKTFTIGDTTISYTSTTKISDVLSQINATGVTATFDADNGRIFISGSDTGADNDFNIVDNDGAAALLGLTSEGGATKIDASDAVMVLNGAEFTSSTNVFTINGSTYTVNSVSTQDANGNYEETTITTQDDYEGIYDTIKNFLTKYNELINEMCSLYNADSASDYEPLLTDEKSELTDTEIEEWEEKIQSALLRKDSTLSSVISTMTTAMASGVTVNGKTMYLSDFGISTLGYFTAEENEHYAYHIDGDSEDESTSGNTDKLLSMIASDPETVMEFFSGLAQNLYSELSTSMSRLDGVRSIYKVYNDKQMDSDLEDYEDKIEKALEKLEEYENRWYDKFSAMETALSKLSSKQNAISSLLGSS